MRDITAEAERLVDIWPYVDQVESDDLGGADFFDVETVYRDGSERFDHVLVTTQRQNVYLVVVVDRHGAIVHGHHLLDLNSEYGLDAPD